MTTQETSKDQGYVLGHSESELARLERQASFFAEMTRDGLVRAGIGPGMRVLDLGCGVGDVSLIASGLVGQGGQVTGIDISESALGIARARAASTGNNRVDFRQSTIEAFEGYENFDAVVGRFIVIHIPDPVAMLKSVAARVRTGVPIAFLEMDIGTAAATTSLPLFERSMGQITEVYRKLGSDPDTGSRLYAMFRAAGLDPDLFGSTRVGSQRDLAGFAFLAESVRSLMPAMGQLGIATPEQIGIETLRDRLIAEAVAADPCIFFPRFVAGWARS